MKIKYTIIYAALAVAFAGACAWVFLSGGKSAKAVRAKFRIGGLMLTVASMLAVASCEGPGPFVSCYDVAEPEYVTFAKATQTEVKVGDVIEFKIDTDVFTSKKFSYEIVDAEGKLIQSGDLVMVGNDTKVTIGETEYRGRIYLWVYADGGAEFGKYRAGIKGFLLK